MQQPASRLCSRLVPRCAASAAQRHQLLEALCCWAGNSERSKGCVGRHEAPFQSLLSVASSGKSWGESQVSRVSPGAEHCWIAGSLLMSVLPLATGRGCPEHPSPSSGSWLSCLRNEGSKGEVLASEGSCWAPSLEHAGGKVENCCSNYATRHAFITRTTVWAHSAPFLLLLRVSQAVPRGVYKVFSHSRGNSTAQRLRVINIV